MPRPFVATYRLQLAPGFGFADVAQLTDYFIRLGISHPYLSPPFEARQGSAHGYDVTDPRCLRVELGGEEDFLILARAVAEDGLGLLIDIVPNHMALDSANPYLWDVLARGPQSEFAGFFDIDWAKGDRGAAQIILPILGSPLEEVLKQGELTLAPHNGGRRLRYYDWELPVAEGSPAAGRGRQAVSPALLERQHYALCWWKDLGSRLNYRRFFDIHELIAVRADEPAVFKLTHSKIIELAELGLIDGVRIDHIDGVKDPAAYLELLGAALHKKEREPLVVVEKILGSGEQLEREWGVDGTTGYEFLRAVDELFVDAAGLGQIEEFYRSHDVPHRTFSEAERRCKELVLRTILYPELRRLQQALEEYAREALPSLHLERAALEQELITLIACFPRYRSYVSGRAEADNARQTELWRSILSETDIKPPLPQILDSVFIAVSAQGLTADLRTKALEVCSRLQQVAAPAAAKGIEDTAFYRYIPLLSRNEVGAHPAPPARLAVSEFHVQSEQRFKYFPRSLLSLSTHDAKRSADARARLAAISEFAGEWRRLVESLDAQSEELCGDSRNCCGAEARSRGQAAALHAQSSAGS